MQHICLSSIDWAASWQIHHELATRLAATGEPVLFVETLGVRKPGFSDWHRLRARLVSRTTHRGGIRQLRPNLWVHSPVVLPFPYCGAVAPLNRRMLLGSLNTWRAGLRQDRLAVWCFLPTPLAHEALLALDADVSVYCCMDDLGHTSAAAQPLEASEARFVRDVDVVLASSHRLLDRLSAMHDHVLLCPPGVHCAMFAAAREARPALPAAVADLPRPIIGYLGGLHRWVDVELLRDLAERHPTASVVLLGPVESPEFAALDGIPNIHQLGRREHSELPAYLRAFDVGVVPYRLHAYTASVSPTKVNEYLAMALPVVSTALPEMRRFVAAFGDVVEIVEHRESFAAAVMAAIGSDTPERRQQRIAVAQRNDLEGRFAFMRRVADEVLATPRPLSGLGAATERG